MKNFIIILFTVVSIFPNKGFSIAEELQQVFQKQFDGPIENIILENVETTVEKAQAMGVKSAKGRPSDKIKIDVPKVLILENAVKFLENDHIKKEVAIGDEEHTYLVNSPELIKLGYNKSHIKIIEDKGIGVVDSSSLTILDNDGNEIINKSFTGSYDFIVSDSGEFVAFESADGLGREIYFYNSNGNLIKQVTPFKKFYWSHLGTYSKSSKYVAVSFDKYGTKGGALILYDTSGNEIWRKELTGLDSNIVSKISFSPNEQYIYLTGSFDADKTGDNLKDYMFILDINGNTLLGKEQKMDAIFSPDGNYLGLSKGNRIDLIDMRNKKTIFSYDSESDVTINSVDISRDAEFLIVSTRRNPDIENKKVLIFDKEGNLVIERTYISEDKSIERIIVKINDSGDKVSLIHGKKVEILNLIK